MFARSTGGGIPRTWRDGVGGGFQVPPSLSHMPLLPRHRVNRGAESEHGRLSLSSSTFPIWRLWGERALRRAHWHAPCRCTRIPAEHPTGETTRDIRRHFATCRGSETLRRHHSCAGATNNLGPLTPPEPLLASSVSRVSRDRSPLNGTHLGPSGTLCACALRGLECTPRLSRQVSFLAPSVASDQRSPSLSDGLGALVQYLSSHPPLTRSPGLVFTHACAVPILAHGTSFCVSHTVTHRQTPCHTQTHLDNLAVL